MLICRRNPQLESKLVATRDKSYETLEMLGKQEKQLLEKAAAQAEKAEKFTRAKNEKAALQCLERKRLYEQYIEQLGTAQSQIHDQLTLMIGCFARLPQAAWDEAPQSERDRLYKSLDLIEETERVLLKFVAAEVEKAEEFTRAENERAAIQCLERKKSYEQQLEQIGTIRLLIHDRLTVMITREDGIAIITETIDAPAEDVAA